MNLSPTVMGGWGCKLHKFDASLGFAFRVVSSLNTRRTIDSGKIYFVNMQTNTLLSLCNGNMQFSTSIRMQMCHKRFAQSHNWFDVLHFMSCNRICKFSTSTALLSLCCCCVSISATNLIRWWWFLISSKPQNIHKRCVVSGRVRTMLAAQLRIDFWIYRMEIWNL